MRVLLQDLRYGLRTFLKRPGFTAIALIALALGIGANTAIFSVVSAVLLRPLPFRDPDALVSIQAGNQGVGVAQTFLTEADVFDLRQQARSFEQVAAWQTSPTNLSGTGRPERLEGISVTTNFFSTLGVQPIMGRAFTAEDAVPNANPVIISYGLWRRQYGGDPHIIGSKISLDGTANNSLVVGVMSPEFNFPQRADIWMPFEIDPSDVQRGGNHNYRTFARLKPGVTVEQARAEAHSIAQNLASQYPDTNAGWDIAVSTFRDYFFGSANVALPLLLGAVGLVLLIACTDVANLQMVRAAAREKEIALRLALGAGRARVVRQLLTESVLLALSGGTLGLLLAQLGINLLRSLGPDSVPRLREAAIDFSSLGFTALLSFLTGVVFGLAPALRVSRADLNTVLKAAGRANTASGQRNRFRAALIVSQFALAFILLVGAGLLIRSFWRLQQVNPGFETEKILAAGVSLNPAEYPRNNPRRTAYVQQALARLGGLPGVQSVGAISHVPLGGREFSIPFQVKGQPPAAGKVGPIADIRVISPSYFETLRIPLKKGRVFGDGDTRQPLLVVNDSFARRFLTAGDELGHQLHLQIGSASLDGEIVGVVSDVKARGLDAEARPEIYLSYLYNTIFPIMQFVVRTGNDPEQSAQSVQRELQAIDPNQVVFNVKPLRQYLSETTAQRRFNTLLLVIFAALAVVLAAAGIYGVMSYSVTQRTQEIGIRMALGARPGDILRMLLRQGMGLTLAGVVIGLTGSLILTRVMSSLLFQVSALDPLAFACVILFLTFVALLACYLPARRAMRVEPTTALRYE